MSAGLCQEREVTFTPVTSHQNPPDSQSTQSPSLKLHLHPRTAPGKEKMKRANGDSCFKQCSFKGSVKASRSSSLIQQLWGRDDLELRLRMIFHTLFQRAGLWSPDCSGWSVPAVFCTIWCQRWWLEEMSSPKWNSLWNSISCVSQCAMGTSSSVVYSETDIVRMFHPDSAALSLRPRMERRWPGV